MAIIIERASAGQTVFTLPLHNKTATATVNGSAATISAQSDFSITLTTPTSFGDLVAITFTSVSINPASPFTLYGYGSPASSLGDDGQFYERLDFPDHIYQKVLGSWKLIKRPARFTLFQSNHENGLFVVYGTTDRFLVNFDLPADVVPPQSCLRVISECDCTGGGLVEMRHTIGQSEASASNPLSDSQLDSGEYRIFEQLFWVGSGGATKTIHTLGGANAMAPGTGIVGTVPNSSAQMSGGFFGFGLKNSTTATVTRCYGLLIEVIPPTHALLP